MTGSRFVKSIVYAVLTAILITVSAVLSVRLGNVKWMEDTYFGTNLYWIITAVVLLGGGVFCYREYAKKNPEHHPDVWLFVTIGAVLLLGWIVMFFRYGGLVVGNFGETAYTAVNINRLVMWGMPLPFLVRLTVLAMSTRMECVRHRRIAQVIAVVMIVAFVAVTISCDMVKMLRYVEPIE